MNCNKETLLQFKPSEKLKEFIINEVTIDNDAPEGIKKYKSSVTHNDEDVHLCLADIKWLQDRFTVNHDKENCDRSNSFHDLMIGCDVQLPEPEVVPRSQELEARIQRLKAEQAARDYKAMTKGVDSVRIREPEDSIAYQLKQINKQLIAVAQFVFSVLAGFAFGFIGIELLVGNLDFGFRLLLGVMFSLIIALAEIYFLAKKLSEDLPSNHIYSQQQVNRNSKPHQE